MRVQLNITIASLHSFRFFVKPSDSFCSISVLIAPLNYFGISRSIIYLVVHTIALLGVKFKLIYRESLNGRRQCTGKKGRGPRRPRFSRARRMLSYKRLGQDTSRFLRNIIKRIRHILRPSGSPSAAETPRNLRSFAGCMRG